MVRSSKKIKMVYRLMALALILIPALDGHAEGTGSAAASAPVAIGISAAPVSVNSPVSTAAPTLSTSPQSGLPPVISEKGASTAPLGDVVQQTSPTKEGTPTAKDAKTAVDATIQTGSAEVTEMSAAEKVMGASEDVGATRPQPFRVGKMTQFGYSFFKKSTSFAPVVDVPVGPDYIIGPGDTLVLTASGSLEGTFPLEVNRSGEVILPKVGAVRVWGVPFGEVSELLKVSLTQAFRTVQVNVTMGKLRLIKVYLVGEVESPGDYDVNALSTVINALAAAGGPSKNGTLRAIQVIRAGKVTETIDLYDFFLKGDKSRDIRLQPGDTINVPIHGNLVGIGGNVRKPAIYEFLNEINLKELLDIAGGVQSSGYLQRIQLLRTVANERRLVEDFNFDPKLTAKEFEDKAANIKLRDMDLVKIMPIDFTVRDQVRLDGYVLRPGGYALKPGMRVKELIGTDNLLPEYYPDTVEITRLMPPDFHPEKTYVNLDRAMLGNDKDNILLAEFDIVHIYSRFEMEEMPVVTISGEVIRPGTFRLNKNERVTDLVKEGGNLKRKGYTKAVEIRRLRFGKELITPYSIYINLEQASKGDLTQNILLEPFDEVIVRKWDNDDTRVVTINGEVHRPGEYRLADGMTVKDLVTAAGELTLKGFAKRVEIRRIRYGTDLVFPYSIYVNLEEAAKGNPKDNILLQHLDEVVVKKWDYDITQVVRISGEVFRPGEYRLVKGMTIADLVMEAGNVKKSAFLNNAEITRLKLTGSSITSYPITVSLENALKGAPEANIPLQDLDEVMIRRIPEWMEETERYVTMRGEVRFPGTYPIFKGEKLSSVLLRAGAYTDKAYLKGAKFTRKSVRELQQIRMDEVIARMEQNLARKQQDLASVAASKEELEATRTALAGMKVTVDKLKTVKAEGRISIHLSALDELKESPYDLELQGGDSLEVPMSTNSVMVFGEVYNPTTVVQIPGKDLGYYLKKAGGATINSDKDEMYVIRADGTVESRQEKNSFLFYDGFTSMDLDAGDTIVVPQVIEKVAWMRELKDIAFILGQVALAGGVLIAAGL